jgi:hypothetical protein
VEQEGRQAAVVQPRPAQVVRLPRPGDLGQAAVADVAGHHGQIRRGQGLVRRHGDAAQRLAVGGHVQHRAVGLGGRTSSQPKSSISRARYDVGVIPSSALAPVTSTAPAVVPAIR